MYIERYVYRYRLTIVNGINYLGEKYIQCGPKKSLWCDLDVKCLRNSKIFFDGVFLSICIFTSCQIVRAF